MAHDFTIIAHRGFSSKAPENTVAAFDLAVNNGFTNLELDVQLSSDGVPVVIHDPTVDRTTNGSGNVRGHTLQELLQLDAGSWFGAEFENERIITLDGLLDKYAQRAHLHIELKSNEPDLPQKVADLLARHGLLTSAYDSLFGVPGITITSFMIEQLERSLSVLSHRFTHGWLVESMTEDAIETARNTGVKQICPKAQGVTKELVGLAHSSGLTVRGQGVQEDADIRHLYEAGVLGATTNWPDKARQILNFYS